MHPVGITREAQVLLGKTEQQHIICYTVRPDVVAGQPGDVYAYWAPENGIIPLAARVRGIDTTVSLSRAPGPTAQRSNQTFTESTALQPGRR